MSSFVLTHKLYMDDSYLKRCSTEVKSIDNDRVTLERTILHPHSGGVANDLGTVFGPYDKGSYDVINVLEDRSNGDVIHILSSSPSFRVGDIVEITLDWDRRYKLMKLHTAAHILSSVMYRSYGALITGGQIDPDVAKDDYNLERADRTIYEGALDEVNAIISRAIEVKIYYLSREKALAIPGIVKLVDRMPPEGNELRIVEIPGIDIQADGGPHVRNTSEIGNIELLKVENKGKNRKRIYYKMSA
jgi:misacylated tRNA(Ala) deacylase